MKKQHIVTALLVVVFMAAIGGVYQFYLRTRLEQYRADEERLAALQDKHKSLSTSFDGVKPDVALPKWQSALQPWTDAVDRRATYFDLGKMSEFKAVPEGVLPKFHYETEYNRLYREFQQATYGKGIMVPQTTFNVPTPSQVSSTSITAEQANDWLRELSLGISMLKLFTDAGINPVMQFYLWPTRTEFNVLEMHTVGVAFASSLENLTKFLNDLKTKDRYYTVNAIRITNRSLRMASPQLYVEMLVTTAQYDASKAAMAGMGTTNKLGTSRFGTLSTSRTSSSSSSTTKKKPEPWYKKVWPF